MKIDKVILSTIFALFLAGIIAGGSFYYGLTIGKSQCEICSPEDLNFSLFWEAYQKLQENYVDKEKFDIQKLIYGAISGMVKSLNDPYTVFMDPEEAKIFNEDVNGSLEGVGMEFGIKKGQMQVITPLENTPAQRAGLRAEDKIIKINDKITIDMTTEEAVRLIRGPKGTEVTLTIFREGWDKYEDIKIIRDVIKIPSLKLEIIKIPSLKLEIKNDNIAYLKLYQFSGKADADFNEAAMDILNSEVNGIILDLRNNPGGYLEVAQYIAGWFLEKGQIVTIQDFGKGREKERIEYKSEGNAALSGYPIVILINEGSASASEILAGALKDNRNAQIIGKKSFGKGSVQETKDLSDESCLKITVAKWLTPKGNSISEVGIEPDIKVELTDEDYKNKKDPQLDKAIEIIKNL
ncbi:hypothetical protein BWK69_00115 [Candidatus Parcubacteria bacterium A4]|nr:MAG: hypothetical protein BWK69_00115 [Candidatus Parcubacteria bacterium A4]